MSIAEKITTIANNMQSVYDKGYADGQAEGGGDNYYDTFWDAFQQNGKKLDYRYAFAYDVWTDETYNPKYPIKQNGYAYTYSMFGDNTKLTDTKVDIELLNTTGSNTSVFSGATALVTIPKLIVGGNATFSGWFTKANSLTNIVVEGSIDVSISFSFSPLSKTSIESIINALLDSAEGQTVTFKKTAVNNAFGIDVDDETTFPEGSEYYELRNSKSNWTFNYV